MQLSNGCFSEWLRRSQERHASVLCPQCRAVVQFVGRNHFLHSIEEVIYPKFHSIPWRTFYISVQAILCACMDRDMYFPLFVYFPFVCSWQINLFVLGCLSVIFCNYLKYRKLFLLIFFHICQNICYILCCQFHCLMLVLMLHYFVYNSAILLVCDSG